MLGKLIMLGAEAMSDSDKPVHLRYAAVLTVCAFLLFFHMAGLGEGALLEMSDRLTVLAVTLIVGDTLSKRVSSSGASGAGQSETSTTR